MPRHTTVTTILVIIALFIAGPAPCQEGTVRSAPDVIPPATPDMQRAGFWTGRMPEPDRMLLSGADIAALNERNSRRSLVRSDVRGGDVSYENLAQRGYQGLQVHRVDPLSLNPAPGDSVGSGIAAGASFVERRDLWDRRHIPFTDGMKRSIIESMDQDAIPATVTPETGLIVRHTLVRRVPSHLAAYGRQYDWLDMFQIGAFETGTPVAVYHRSRDGDWLYVKDYFLFGWVPAANVAFGSDEELRKFAEPEHFVVALAHRVPVYSAESAGNIWLADIFQGTKLPLESKDDPEFVTAPVRRPDGSLGTARGRLKEDAGVHVGYQPFTRRNIVETIFRLMDHPYGWGDSAHERDCCGIIRTVFNTFGIFTPRAPTHQFLHTDTTLIFPEDTPKTEKERLLGSCAPGNTLCGFGGHIMLYLGEVDGNHFVVHSNGYSYHDPDGTELRVARTSVTDTNLEGGSDIERFTHAAEYGR